ncbi:MAG: hypothetical protein LBF12_04160, partial [Christensenellaceae bacterium]|nr:hypothetical protein [Christensenellaceae bacterium]
MSINNKNPSDNKSITGNNIIDNGLKQTAINVSLEIFHQNIRGLRNKLNELYCHLSYKPPHIICISEHHLKDYELHIMYLHDYVLGAKYCRKIHQKGGVCIFVNSNLKYDTLNLEEYTIEKDIEACAILLPLKLSGEKRRNNKFCILTIYRSPSGNFKIFLERLDNILIKLYHEHYNIIVCGDIKVNYLKDDSRKNQLDTIMHSYNLNGIVTFPTRVDTSTRTIIDNFFIDTTRIDAYDVYPVINGLSDHDAQILILHMVQKPIRRYNNCMKRMINDDAIANFKMQLSYESWESILEENDVNKSFNLFLNTFLRIYYFNFPLLQTKCRPENKLWITSGIIKSCKHKREIYKELRNNNKNNTMLRIYYRSYSKILTAVIKKAKRMEYDKCILNSRNKIKTTWGIIQKEVGRNTNKVEINAFRINGSKFSDQQKIVGELTNYFANIAENIKRQTKKNYVNVNNHNNTENSIDYMGQAFANTYQTTTYNCSTQKEIEDIIKSLKQKNSYGYDEISPIILKISAPFI